MRKKKNSQRIKNLMILVLILSGFIRLVLGFINPYSDDPHIIDINHLVDTGEFPDRDKGTCTASCYTPKFYYFVNAEIIRVFNINMESRERVGNLVSVIAGIITLLCVYLFLLESKLKPLTKLATFSIVAFNPGLIRVNIQIIPDSFVICFAVISSYFAFLFLKRRDTESFLLMSLFCILTCITKMNGIVLFLSILSILGLITIIERKYRKRNFIYLICFLGLILLIVPWFGGYFDNYLIGGNFITYDTYIEKNPLYFFKETYIDSPGITSFYKGYLNFPLLSLIRNPKIVNYVSTNTVLEEHMTSLWTQIYGRSLFLPFSCGMFNGNETMKHYLWFQPGSFYLFLGRTIMILGLSLIFLFFSGLFSLLELIINKKLKIENAFLSLLSIAYLGFMVIFTMRYRDFYYLKEIYIYPGLIGHIFVFSLGLDNQKKLYKFFLIIIGVIILIHLLDVTHIYVAIIKSISSIVSKPIIV